MADSGDPAGQQHRVNTGQLAFGHRRVESFGELVHGGIWPAPDSPVAPRRSIFGGAPNCGDWVMAEGYSHELSSCGFWPGGGDEGAFYAYAYPEPDGFADYPVLPEQAFYSTDNGQFLLPYEAVRTAADPDRTLLEFLHGTYRDRAALEVDPRRWEK